MVKKIIKNILAYIFLIIIVLIIIFLIFILLFKLNYNRWEENFLNSNVLFLDLEDNHLRENIQEKILSYNMDTQEYAFVKFTDEEALYIFYEAISDSIPHIFSVTGMGLVAYQGDWDMYSEIEIYGMSFWVCFNLKKEAVQSIDIYVDDILIGGISINDLFLNLIIDDVNDGISRSLRLINDGDFAGRVFENIELLEDALVIRSRSIEF